MEIDEGSIEEQILKILEERGTPLSWLAVKTGYSYSYLTSILKTKGQFKATLTESVLKTINQVLKTDFKIEQNGPIS